MNIYIYICRYRYSLLVFPIGIPYVAYLTHTHQTANAQHATTATTTTATTTYKLEIAAHAIVLKLFFQTLHAGVKQHQLKSYGVLPGATIWHAWGHL